MESKPKRGRKPLPKGEKRIDVRFSIKESIIEKYGKENLLKPSIAKENQ